MRNKNIILAYKKTGIPQESDGPLMLAGHDLPSRNSMVKQIAKIRLVITLGYVLGYALGYA